MHPFRPTSFRVIRSNNRKLGGGNVQGVNIGSKPGKGLLGAVRPETTSVLGTKAPLAAGNQPDEGVDLDAVNVVQLLERILDVPLVGLDVNDEDERVVLLNLLHGALGVERVNDDLAGVEARDVRHALAGVLWRARQVQRLGLVEGRRETDLAHFVRVDLCRETGRQRWSADTRGVSLGAAYAFEGSLGCGVGLALGRGGLLAACEIMLVTN